MMSIRKAINEIKSFAGTCDFIVRGLIFRFSRYIADKFSKTALVAWKALQYIALVLGKNFTISVGVFASSALISMAFVFFYNNIEDLEKLDAYGSYISGVLASAAFVWIIVAGWMQHKGLKALIESNKAQFRALQTTHRLQDLEILEKYQAIVMPLIYNDCVLLLSKANSEGIITDFDPNKFTEYNLNNHKLLVYYIETSDQIADRLPIIQNNPANNLMLAVIYRLKARISLFEDYECDDVYLISTNLQPSDIAAYRYISKLFDNAHAYRTEM